MNYLILELLIGAAGALVKMIIEDGGLILPCVKDGKCYLGFIGGALIGAAAGALTDGEPVAIFLGGYAGTSLITFLTRNQANGKTTETQSIEAQIRTAAVAAGIDPDLAVRIAQCESSLNPLAVNINEEGSTDRGLYQINNKYHPEVTDAQAFDPAFSIQFFITAFKAGNISWWNSSKTCWNK